MSYSIVNQKPTLEEIRTVLRETPLVALREMLTDQHIYDACSACGHKFRERKYGPVVTVFHFLLQAIQREESFSATWQELWTPIIADFPEMDLVKLDRSALTHARKRLPKEVLEMLAAEACAQTDQADIAKWKGLRLLALDGSTVSMPREDDLFEHFGAHHARTTTVRYPLGTIAFLLNVATSLVLDYRFGPYDPGEDKTCRPLFNRLGPVSYTHLTLPTILRV